MPLRDRLKPLHLKRGWSQPLVVGALVATSFVVARVGSYRCGFGTDLEDTCRVLLLVP